MTNTKLPELNCEWSDISSNAWREYIFPDNFVIKIIAPVKLNISNSGGHRILDSEGISWYIPSKWIAIKWKGDPNFVL